MSKNTGSVWGWSGVACTTVALITYNLLAPSQEEEIIDAGYDAEKTTALTCYDENGTAMPTEYPENVQYISQDPVNVIARYPSFFNGTINVNTREPSIYTNIDGCTFETLFTSSDLSEIADAAPISLTVSNGKGNILTDRFSTHVFNRDTGQYSALLLDQNGVLLKQLEVFGLTTAATQITPSIPIPEQAP